MANHRIIDVELDESSIVRWTPDIDHERRVAIFDLLEDNSFEPKIALPGDYTGPYKLILRIEDNRLAFDIKSEADEMLGTVLLPMLPFRRIIREYFAICESYFNAIRSSSPAQIEAIDMGRRGVHNEGSELLQERLQEKAVVDFDTARRLFTLMCVLHLRG